MSSPRNEPHLPSSLLPFPPPLQLLSRSLPRYVDHAAYGATSYPNSASKTGLTPSILPIPSFPSHIRQQLRQRTPYRCQVHPSPTQCSGRRLGGKNAIRRRIQARVESVERRFGMTKSITRQGSRQIDSP